MVYTLIPVLLVTLAGISLAARTGRKFADLMAPVMLAAMVVLFLSYIGGFLLWGQRLIVALCLLSAALVLPEKHRKQLRQVLSQTSFRWYLLGILVVFLFALGKYVILWDSLRLWGAVPKALHTNPVLQLGESAAIYPTMQSYPPGMHLLCWFFASFAPVFPEASLYFTYSFFGIVLMLPMLGKVDEKSGRVQLTAFALMIFLPRLLSSMNNEEGFYYASLYIDIPLGICCGYCFSRAFRFARGDGFDSLCLILSCAGLAMLKDSGAVFALFAIAAMAVQTLLNRKTCPVAKKLLTTALAAAVLVSIWVTWKHMLNTHTVTNHLSMTLEIPGIMTLARLFFYLLRTPVTGIFTLTGSIHLSLPAALLILFGLRLLLSRQNPGASFREEIANVAIEFFCYAVFFLGWYLTFPEAIANQFYPSYVRYFCTLVTCSLYVLLSDCVGVHLDYLDTVARELGEFAERSVVSCRLLRSAGKVIGWAFIICFVFTAALVIFDFPASSEPTHARALEGEAALTETLDTGDVYMVNPEDSGITTKLHHFLYYALIDDGIRIRNFFNEQDIAAEGLTPEDFLRKLEEEGCRFVYITVMTESLLEIYGRIFPGAALAETDLIYRLEGDTLTRIR